MNLYCLLNILINVKTYLQVIKEIFVEWVPGYPGCVLGLLFFKR